MSTVRWWPAIGTFSQPIPFPHLTPSFYLFLTHSLTLLSVTRIIIYLMEVTLPFRLQWLGPFFVELTTLFFYVLTGYMFVPGSANEYMRLSARDSDDEDDGELREMVSTTSMTEGVHKTRSGNASAAAAKASGEARKAKAQAAAAAAQGEPRDVLDAAYEVLNLGDEGSSAGTAEDAF